MRPLRRSQANAAARHRRLLDEGLLAGMTGEMEVDADSRVDRPAGA